MGARLITFVITALLLTMFMHLFNFTSQDTMLTNATGISANWTESNLGTDIQAGLFWTFFFGGAGILVGIVISGISARLLGASNPENFIVLPALIGVFGLFIGSFTDIMTNSGLFENFIRIPITMIMILYSAAYIITMVEWFRGNT